MNVYERNTCRLDDGGLEPVLNLGDLHFSDFLYPDQIDTPKYPLELCVGESSGLLQLRHTVNPEQMYRNYHYVSGLNEHMVQHLRSIVRSMSNFVQPGDMVLDIGCNDGTLLQAYPEGVIKIGYDPSNVKPTGVDEYHNDFFDERALQIFPPRSIKVVTTIAMFYDIENPRRFAEVIAEILAEDGVWVIEMHYARDMVNRVGFDAICHEHLTYYDLHSLKKVFAGTGLYMTHVEFNDVNGGSFRVHVRKHNKITPELVKAWRHESEFPLDYAAFKDNVIRNADTVRNFFERAKREGRLIHGYGASTKGSTMAQFYGLNKETMPVIADRNPHKWGLITSGTHIPVVSEEYSRGVDPDHYFVFPYHFINGFVKREYHWLSNVSRRRSEFKRSLIVPVPVITQYQMNMKGEMSVLQNV